MEVTDIHNNDQMMEYAEILRNKIIDSAYTETDKVNDINHKKLILSSWLIGIRRALGFIISTILINSIETENDIIDIREYLLDNTAKDINANTASVDLIKEHIEHHDDSKYGSH